MGHYLVIPLYFLLLGYKKSKNCPSWWIRQILFLNISNMCSMSLQLLALAQNTAVGSKCSFSNHHLAFSGFDRPVFCTLFQVVVVINKYPADLPNRNAIFVEIRKISLFIGREYYQQYSDFIRIFSQRN